MLHFQLQVTIGSYGYEPAEMYFVHGVLLLLAIVVVRWVMMQVCMQPPLFCLDMKTPFMPGHACRMHSTWMPFTRAQVS